MKEIPNYNPEGFCFFCGPNNPIGMKLRFFRTDDDQVVARFTPTGYHVGLGKLLHGGLMAGLFDEIMGWTAHQLGAGVGVTSHLEVDYLAPAEVDREIELRCRIAERKGRRINLTARLTGADGKVCAKATGVYVMMDKDRFNKLVGLTEQETGENRDEEME